MRYTLRLELVDSANDDYLATLAENGITIAVLENTDHLDLIKDKFNETINNWTHLNEA